MGFRGGITLVIVVCAACGSFGDTDEPPTGKSSDAGADTSTSDPGSDGAPPSDAASADSADAKDGGSGPCPEGVGPKMREVKLVNSRTICVDVTEVTSAQYAAFRSSLVDTAPFVTKVPAGCGALAAVALSPVSGNPGMAPQVNVSFCSAAFFCAAQGKRLCGNATDGSSIIYEGGTPAPPNEWELACANGKSAAFYPWGDQNPAVAVSANCEVKDKDPTAIAPRAVGVAPTCGPPGNAGPFDMIGNVWEWVNVREDDMNGSYTGLRGGSFAESTLPDGCGSGHGLSANVQEYAQGNDTTGFRCCSDPL